MDTQQENKGNLMSNTSTYSTTTSTMSSTKTIRSPIQPLPNFQIHQLSYPSTIQANNEAQDSSTFKNSLVNSSRGFAKTLRNTRLDSVGEEDSEPNYIESRKTENWGQNSLNSSGFQSLGSSMEIPLSSPIGGGNLEESFGIF